MPPLASFVSFYFDFVILNIDIDFLTIDGFHITIGQILCGALERRLGLV